jgi:hypothetical protein
LTKTGAEERIGAYRVVRVIHSGVTSVVMEVVDDSTHRRLAIKQLAGDRCDDASERRKFAFEAKLGLELRHPSLIRVHEYVADREQPYFVMEYFWSAPTSTRCRRSTCTRSSARPRRAWRACTTRGGSIAT